MTYGSCNRPRFALLIASRASVVLFFAAPDPALDIALQNSLTQSAPATSSRFGTNSRCRLHCCKHGAATVCQRHRKARAHDGTGGCDPRRSDPRVCLCAMRCTGAGRMMISTARTGRCRPAHDASAKCDPHRIGHQRTAASGPTLAPVTPAGRDRLLSKRWPAHAPRTCLRARPLRALTRRSLRRGSDRPAGRHKVQGTTKPIYA